MKILVIEDEIDILNAVRKGLTKSGYIVETATDGAEGLELCYVNDYDLVVLDLNLPSMDGLDILREIRKKNKNLRILILSARNAIENRIQGLDLGANDYLVKPFHFGELEARIRSLLRRSFTQEDATLSCGELCMDTIGRKVALNGNAIELTPKEYLILEYLLMNKGQFVSSEKLIEHTGDSDTAMFSNAVKVHISSIRKKLGVHSSCDFIKNARGAGYIIEEENHHVS